MKLTDDELIEVIEAIENDKCEYGLTADITGYENIDVLESLKELRDLRSATRWRKYTEEEPVAMQLCVLCWRGDDDCDLYETGRLTKLGHFISANGDGEELLLPDEWCYPPLPDKEQK
jgi:hypothetical protein